MPTGYTSELYEGKPQTFREFGLQCARAFGALISMRDEPNDAPIKLEEVGEYHSKAIAEAEKALAELKNMSLQEAERQATQEFNTKSESYRRQLSEREGIRNRYESMLQQVNDWTPPTTEHEGLKKFMIDQLKESIDFDTKFKPEIPQKTPVESWIQNRIRKEEWNLNYHREQHHKEVQRVNERNGWVNDLLASLPNDTRSLARPTT